MENLIFLFLGMLIITQILSGLALYKLYQNQRKQGTRIIEAYRQIAVGKKDYNKLFDASMINTENLQKIVDKTVRIFRLKYDSTVTKFDRRLIKLERIPIEPHLNLTQQQIVNKRVEEKIQRERPSAENILDFTRQAEMDEYNREMYKDS
jgi:divalent metal cation (Fe/Co/Zn/Cd) transporter